MPTDQELENRHKLELDRQQGDFYLAAIARVVVGVVLIAFIWGLSASPVLIAFFTRSAPK